METEFHLHDKKDDFESRAAVHAKADLDYKLWQELQEELHPEKTGRFLVTSIFLHAMFVLIAFAASLQMFEDKKNETVEIEFLNSPSAVAKGETLTESASAPAMPSAPAALKPVAAAAPEKSNTDDVMIPAKAEPVKTVAAKPAPKMSIPAPAPRAAAVPVPVKTSSAVQAFKGESPAVIPESVDDIKAPSLAEASAAPVNASEINDDEDLKKDFDKVDHHQKKQVMALAQDLENQNQDAMSESEKIANDASKENEVEGEKIASFNAAQRARDAQAVVAANAAERAASARAQQQANETRAAALAAKDAKDSQDAEAANAALAAHEKSLGEAIAASKAQAAKEQALKDAAGSGKGSDKEATPAAAGIPTGVRDATDLRQRPGNPTPQYEQKERLLGHQGKVVFLAYVTPEGVPTQFKLSDSTGHKNLDAKTLAALKQWRFYPGQEGWVEMAFSWSLKGGAQEMPALLKRSAK